jgi:hypothetical protein
MDTWSWGWCTYRAAWLVAADVDGDSALAVFPQHLDVHPRAFPKNLQMDGSNINARVVYNAQCTIFTLLSLILG